MEVGVKVEFVNSVFNKLENENSFVEIIDMIICEDIIIYRWFLFEFIIFVVLVVQINRLFILIVL